MLAALALAAPFTLTGAPSAVADTSLEGVPRVQHVVILVLENESFTTTWSPSSAAKYLNGLVHRGAFVPQYYGTGHVSLDNYIAMTSGLAGPLIAPTYTDCGGLNLYTCVQDVSTAATTGSIADQIESAGLTWKEYADGTSAPCVHDSYATTAGSDSYQGTGTSGPESSTANANYADRHVPFLYYRSIIENDARCDSHLRPFTEMQADMAHDTLPSYAFVTPDTCNDGHNATCPDGRPGGLTAADAFLTANVPAMLAYLQAHDGVLLITFDEADNSDVSGCCHGGPAGQRGFGGQVGLLALGPMVHTGYTSTQQYDHASLLRTTEDLLGIGTYLNNAAASTPMTDIWATAASPSATASPQPVTPASLGGTPPALPDTTGTAPRAAAASLLALLTLLGLGGVIAARRHSQHQLR